MIKNVWSPYVSLIIVVPRTRGKLSLSTDFRELNSIAETDYYSLLCIEDILAMIAGCNYTSLLNLVLGFNQLSLYPADKHKLVFITLMGHY